MGYRKYAKDYEIEYVDRPGKKRPKAVRIYVGPYFRIDLDREELRKLRLLFLLGILAVAIFLLFPMLIDCGFTRSWYIMVPAAFAWIPWVFGALSVVGLFRAGPRIDREHRDGIYDRMGGATVFLIIFCGLSVVGSAVGLFRLPAKPEDLAVVFCNVTATALSVMLFVFRRRIRFAPVENPERPQTKKKS